MLTELDVVNAQLAIMGQAPLTSLVAVHPLVATARAVLAKANMSVQQRGWWFNESLKDLVPDPLDSYFITGQLTADNIKIQPPANLTLSVRTDGTDSWLYDHSTGDIYEKPVTVRETYLVAYARLPLEAQLAVHDLALWKFQSDHAPDSTKAADLSRAVGLSYNTLVAQDIRVKRRSLLDSPTTATRLLQIRGRGPYIRFGG